MALSQKINNTALVLCALVIGSGCVTREDIRGIQTDLVSIQKNLDNKFGSVEDQTTNVQTSQADLRLDMQELSQNISMLKGELQESRMHSAELAAKLDDLEASLRARMDAQIELLSGSKFAEKPLPTTVYNLANTDFIRGKNIEAIKGFNSYLTQFPSAANVPEAKLNIGDAYSKLKDWKKAVEAYNNLIENHPDSRLVPTAMLRKGKAFEEQGKFSSADSIYVTIIKKYPNRAEAQSAQLILKQRKVPSSSND